MDSMLKFYLVVLKKNVAVNPEKILDYFENVVCTVRANNLHTYSVGLALRYSSRIFVEHSKEYRCRCFKCRIHQLLAKTIISRGYRNIIYISGCRNVIILT